MEQHTEELLSFSPLGRYNGVHIWGGMMECTPWDEACVWAVPRQTVQPLPSLYSAGSWLHAANPRLKKNIAQDDTAVGFSALYQHSRFKSIIRKTFLCLIFTRALSSKTSFKQSWCSMWSWPLSGKA